MIRASAERALSSAIQRADAGEDRAGLRDGADLQLFLVKLLEGCVTPHMADAGRVVEVVSTLATKDALHLMAPGFQQDE